MTEIGPLTSNEGRRPATDAESRALASSLRMRILRVCLDAPHTNREIADILAKDPATVLHHVRRLVDTGFLAAQAVRRGARGSREIPYLATGQSWRLQSPAAAGVLVEAFLDEAALVPPDRLDATRMGLRLDAAGAEALMDRLISVLEEFRARPVEPDAEAVSVFLAVHPDPNRPS